MMFWNPTPLVRPLFAVLVATLAGTLLAHPAQASTITFDDIFADGHVLLTWTGDFRNITVSANCTAGVGAATCSEAAPIDFALDAKVLFPSPGQDLIEINFWEDFVGGVLSDTLFIQKTPTSDPSIVHGHLIFQSNVDGGPALTPFLGNSVFNLVENGLPSSAVLGHCNCPDDTLLTVTSDTPAPVPEPASLLLFGSGLLVAARNRWRPRA